MSQWRKFGDSKTQTVREVDEDTKLYVHAFRGHYTYRVIHKRKTVAQGSNQGSGFQGRQAAEDAYRAFLERMANHDAG